MDGSCNGKQDDLIKDADEAKSIEPDINSKSKPMKSDTGTVKHEDQMSTDSSDQVENQNQNSIISKETMSMHPESDATALKMDNKECKEQEDKHSSHENTSELVENTLPLNKNIESTSNVIEKCTEEIVNPNTEQIPFDDESTADESDYIVTIDSKKASADPNFAVIWSFCHVFGDFIGLPRFSLDDMEAALSSTTPLATSKSQEGLLELIHIKLLRKLAKSCKSQFSSLARVSHETLPKFLPKVCDLLDLSFAWDITTFGYHVLSISDKLKLLKHLCDLQFDENPKLRTYINDQYIKTDNASALRYQPIGSDLEGRMAWIHEDITHNNLRLYMVEDDDDDGTTWKLVASNTSELENHIARLEKKSEVNPKDKALQLRKERKEKAKREKEERELNNAKGKKKKAKRGKKESVSDHSDDEDENPCARCFSNRNPEEVLLCDGCDAAYHTLCLRPPLLIIPDNDWYCPFCQQVSLCDRLMIKLKETTTRIKTKERKSKRMDFYGIKLSNIVDDSTGDIGFDGSRRSGRSKKQIDYNFSDFDRIINEATGTKRPNPEDSMFDRTRRNSRRLNDLDAESDASSGNDYIDESSDFQRIARLSRFKYNRRRKSSRRGLRSTVDSEEENEELPTRRTKRRCLAKNSFLLNSSMYVEEGVDTGKRSGDNDEDYDNRLDDAKSVDDEESDIASGSMSDDSLANERPKKRQKIKAISDSDVESIASDIGDEMASSENDNNVDTDDLCESDNDNANNDEEEEDIEISEEEIEIPMPVKSSAPSVKAKSESTSEQTNEATSDQTPTPVASSSVKSPPVTINTESDKAKITPNEKANGKSKSIRDVEKQQRRKSEDTAKPTHQISSPPKQNGAIFQPYRQQHSVPNAQQIDQPRLPTLPQIPPLKKPSLNFGVDQLTSPPTIDTRNFSPSAGQLPHNFSSHPLSPNHYTSPTHGYPHFDPMHNIQMHIPSGNQMNDIHSHGYPMQHPYSPSYNVPQLNKMSHNPMRNSPYSPQNVYSPMMNREPYPNQSFMRWPSNPQVHYPQQQQQQPSPTFQPGVDPLRNFPYPPSHQQQPPT